VAASLDWSDRRSDVDVETGTACPDDEDNDDTKERAPVRSTVLVAHVSFMVAIVLLIVISFFLIMMIDDLSRV
jgi:hypothetical protein